MEELVKNLGSEVVSLVKNFESKMKLLLGEDYQVIMGFQHIGDYNIIHIMASPNKCSNKPCFRTRSEKEMVIGKEFIEIAIRDFLYGVIINSDFLTKVVKITEK